MMMAVMMVNAALAVGGVRTRNRNASYRLANELTRVHESVQAGHLFECCTATTCITRM